MAKRDEQQQPLHHQHSRESQTSQQSTAVPPTSQSEDKKPLPNHQETLIQKTQETDIAGKPPIGPSKTVTEIKKTIAPNKPQIVAQTSTNPTSIQANQKLSSKVAQVLKPGQQVVLPGRPLKHSQSLHGHNDRSSSYRPMETISTIDPSNYIIANPYRAPSRQSGTTATGDESDTVQSIC